MNKLDVYECGVTEILEKKYIYKWEVKNYQKFHRNSENPLNSPIFTLNINGETAKFALMLYPFCRTSAAAIKIVFLSYGNSDIQLYLKLNISIYDKDENNIYSDSKYKFITVKELEKVYDIIDFEKYQTCTEFKKKFSDFTIHCEIAFNHPVYYSQADNFTEEIVSMREKCLDDFENQLNAEKYYDFIIITPCKKEFKVHKFILASRSSMFAALIDSDMIEKKENKTQITDFSYEVVKEMLRFMYCANVKNLENIADELFKAADYYQIEDLKTICLQHLIKNININNAVKALDLSYRYDLHNLSALRKKAIRFIKCHANSIIDNEEFKLLAEDSKTAEIIRAIII